MRGRTIYESEKRLDVPSCSSQSSAEGGMKTLIKKMTYRFNGDLRTEETVLDSEGLLPIHKIGAILKKHGGRWKVTVINHDFFVAGPWTMPVYRVYLTEAM